MNNPKDTTHFFERKDGSTLLEGATGADLLFNSTALDTQQSVSDMKQQMRALKDRRDYWRRKATEDSSEWKKKYGLQCFHRVKEELLRRHQKEEILQVLSKCPQDENVRGAMALVRNWGSGIIQMKSMLDVEAPEFQLFQDVAVCEAIFAKSVLHLHQHPGDLKQIRWLFNQLEMERDLMAKTKVDEIYTSLQEILDRNAHNNNLHYGTHIEQIIRQFKDELFHSGLPDAICYAYENITENLRDWIQGVTPCDISVEPVKRKKKKRKASEVEDNEETKREADMIEETLNHYKELIETMEAKSQIYEDCEFQSASENKQNNMERAALVTYFGNLFELFRRRTDKLNGLDMDFLTKGLLEFFPFHWGRTRQKAKYLFQPECFMDLTLERYKVIANQRLQERFSPDAPTEAPSVKEQLQDVLLAMKQVDDEDGKRWFTRAFCRGHIIKKRNSTPNNPNRNTIAIASQEATRSVAPPVSKRKNRSGRWPCVERWFDMQ